MLPKEISKYHIVGPLLQKGCLFIPSMFVMLTQGRLRWRGHVCLMDDSRNPKDLLYSELHVVIVVPRPTGRPALRNKDVCKRELKVGDVDHHTWKRQPQTVTVKICIKTKHKIGRTEEVAHCRVRFLYWCLSAVTVANPTIQWLVYTATSGTATTNQSKAQIPCPSRPIYIYTITNWVVAFVRLAIMKPCR